MAVTQLPNESAPTKCTTDHVDSMDNILSLIEAIEESLHSTLDELSGATKGRTNALINRASNLVTLLGQQREQAVSLSAKLWRAANATDRAMASQQVTQSA